VSRATADGPWGTGRRALVLLAASASACTGTDPAVATAETTGGGEAAQKLSAEQLQSPETCKPCHTRHYREWKSSMHAYSTDDPVFLAMNARGQQAGVGDFCAKCHAPMAVLAGWGDSANLRELPAEQKGVTCYYCHSVQGVGEPHNNSLLVSASNDVMFGPYFDPSPKAPHRAAHSDYLDGRSADSSAMCGACHDIQLDSGVHLERTYEEWQGSALNALSCARGCHMAARTDTAVPGPAAPAGVGLRHVEDGEGVHEHLFAGVDSVLTPWMTDDPVLEDVQRAAIECELRDAVQITQLCINPGPGGFSLNVSLEAVGAAHGWPSGATQDRRAWIDLKAYRGDSLVFDSSVRPGEPVSVAQADPSRQLAVLGDAIYGASGSEVHMFWEAAPSPSVPLGYRSNLIPSGANHTLTSSYRVPGAEPDRIEVAVQLVPIDPEVLEDLYASGYLSPADHAPLRTLTLAGAQASWRPTQPSECLRNPALGAPSDDCRSRYRALLATPPNPP
jgi:hypothetical protein